MADPEQNTTAVVLERLYAAGFVVVPIKPTEKMLANADAAVANGKRPKLLAKWTAMLAAAPSAEEVASHAR